MPDRSFSDRYNALRKIGSANPKTARALAAMKEVPAAAFRIRGGGGGIPKTGYAPQVTPPWPSSPSEGYGRLVVDLELNTINGTIRLFGPTAIEYTSICKGMAVEAACRLLAERLMAGHLHAKGPGPDGRATAIPAEWWQFGAIGADGGVEYLKPPVVKRLAWFMLDAAELLALFPPPAAWVVRPPGDPLPPPVEPPADKPIDHPPTVDAPPSVQQSVSADHRPAVDATQPVPTVGAQPAKPLAQPVDGAGDAQQEQPDPEAQAVPNLQPGEVAIQQGTPEQIPASDRTGAPGPPSSMHLIEAEMRRRAAAGEMITTTVIAEAEALERWLKVAHPRLRPATAKTIQNQYGKEIRRRQQSTIFPELNKTP